MVQRVLYPHPNHIRYGLAIMTIREHLCGFYSLETRCVDAGVRVDPSTGHRVCCGCDRITVSSGLRKCDMCNREYINLDKYQDNRYETYDPECIERYGLDEE
jgi:hypothetical protein